MLKAEACRPVCCSCVGGASQSNKNMYSNSSCDGVWQEPIKLCAPAYGPGLLLISNFSLQMGEVEDTFYPLYPDEGPLSIYRLMSLTEDGLHGAQRGGVSRVLGFTIECVHLKTRNVCCFFSCESTWDTKELKTTGTIVNKEVYDSKPA